MKIGDRVKVIELMSTDEEETNLEIGSAGVITESDEVNDGSEHDVFDVAFDSIQCSDDANCLQCDGSYTMNRNQLEVIEPTEDTQCK